MDLKLAGKVALITGGSRGIGLRTARLLAEEGHDGIVVEEMHKDTVPAVVYRLEEEVIRGFHAQAYTEVRLYRAHIRIGIEPEVTELVGGIFAVPVDPAHGHVLGRLALGPFSAGDERLLQDIPDLIGFNEEQAHELACFIRGNPAGSPVRAVVGIEDLIYASKRY